MHYDKSQVNWWHHTKWCYKILLINWQYPTYLTHAPWYCPCRKQTILVYALSYVSTLDICQKTCASLSPWHYSLRFIQSPLVLHAFYWLLTIILLPRYLTDNILYIIPPWRSRAELFLPLFVIFSRSNPTQNSVNRLVLHLLYFVTMLLPTMCAQIRVFTMFISFMTKSNMVTFMYPMSYPVINLLMHSLNPYT